MIINLGRSMEKPIIKILLLGIFFSILATIVLSAGNPYYNEPGRDSGAYLYIGQRILDGEQLYIDVWDSKPPIIFGINALGLWLGGGTRWGVWLFEFLFLFGSEWIMFWVIKQRWGVLPALFGVIAGAMSFRLLIGLGNFTEEYSYLFSAIALLVFLKVQKNTPPFLYFQVGIMGAMVALIFWLRANNIGTSFVVTLIALVAIWRHLGLKVFLRSLGAALLGAIIISFFTILPFLLNGSIKELFDASIFYNFEYSFDTRPRMAGALQTTIYPALEKLRGWKSILIIGFMLAIYDFVKGLLGRKLDSFTIALLVILPVEIAATSISGRSYGHYFLLWVPIIGLFAGLCFKYIEDFFLNPRLVKILYSSGISLTMISLIVMFSLIFQTNMQTNIHSFIQVLLHRERGIEYVSPIADYVRQNTDKDERVLVWTGHLLINVMSDRLSVDGPYIFPQLSNAPIGKKQQDDYYGRLIALRPSLIIDGSVIDDKLLPPIDPQLRSKWKPQFPMADNLDQVLDYINANYDYLTEVDGFPIYKIMGN